MANIDINKLNIHSVDDVYNFIQSQIKEGFVSKIDGKCYVKDKMNKEKYEELLYFSYYLQTPEQLLQSRCGLCYDKIELAKEFLKQMGHKVYSYYILFNNLVFLISYDGMFYYIFEPSGRIDGVFVETTLKRAIQYYKNNLVSNGALTIVPHQYDELEPGLDLFQLIDSITKEEKIGTKFKLQLKLNNKI